MKGLVASNMAGPFIKSPYLKSRETMLLINSILGLATDDHLTEQLHTMAHHGRVEYIHLSADDMRRRRLRVKTDRGAECAIALKRTENLSHGSVIWLDETRAIVVKAKKTRLLSFKPTDVDAALELGYLAGNMHWQARVAEGLLKIEMNGAEQAYMDRVAHLVRSGKVRQVEYD